MTRVSEARRPARAAGARLAMAFGALVCIEAVPAVPLEAQRPAPRGAARPPLQPSSPWARLTPADRATLMRLLEVEDRRAPDSASLAPLLDALGHRTAELRRVAARGVGRLQRPELIDDLLPLLQDSVAAVRVEAVNAVGQAMQGLRGGGRWKPEAVREEVDATIDLLVRSAESSRDPRVLGTVARTLGRLPIADPGLSAAVAELMVEMAQRPTRSAGESGPVGRAEAAAAEGIAHGLYALARARRAGAAAPAELLPPSAVDWLRSTLTVRAGGRGAAAEAWARVRRLSVLALATVGDTSAASRRAATQDADEQVRRAALLLLPAVPDTGARRDAVAAALADDSWLVRFEGVRQHRLLGTPPTCSSLLDAVSDPVPVVALAAIDALGAGCIPRERAVDALRGIVERGSPETPSRTRGGSSWHPYARALASLARLDAGSARPHVAAATRHAIWQVRMYAARAAVLTRDTASLDLLARDTHGVVRESAIAGLATVMGRARDATYLAALSSPEYHVVREAAQALRGASSSDSVVRAIFDALDRITAEERETSRDPRVALLERIAEMGSARHVARLERYATDFDSTVAARAASILERWTLRRVVPQPRAGPISPDSVGAVVGAGYRLTVQMAEASGGGRFVVRLFPDEAPATVARLVRLARAGYYDSLTFHRVEPAFVIQGGSPAATEYVGDGPFMRDEVGLRSHTRGTVGISTRGRDTGDAQLFVNLTDNFRLDHDYTVVGEIVEGREVAEQVLEGDVIARVEVSRVP